MPVDLTYGRDQDGEALSGPLYTVQLGALRSSNAGAFGRQAQAISMLDEALRILRSAEASPIEFQAITKLDEKLQMFLALIMREYAGPGRQCGANATVIR